MGPKPRFSDRNCTLACVSYPIVVDGHVLRIGFFAENDGGRNGTVANFKVGAPVLVDTVPSLVPVESVTLVMVVATLASVSNW